MKMHRLIMRTVVAFFLLLIVLDGSARPSGWLVGQISGRTRLVLPSGGTTGLADVSVTLTDIGWGKEWKLQSDRRGVFRFVNLRSGNYTIRVERAGHELREARRRQSVIRLRVNDPVRVLPAYDLVPTGP